MSLVLPTYVADIWQDTFFVETFSVRTSIYVDIWYPIHQHFFSILAKCQNIGHIAIFLKIFATKPGDPEVLLSKNDIFLLGLFASIIAIVRYRNFDFRRQAGRYLVGTFSSITLQPTQTSTHSDSSLSTSAVSFNASILMFPKQGVSPNKDCGQTRTPGVNSHPATIDYRPIGLFFRRDCK